MAYTLQSNWTEARIRADLVDQFRKWNKDDRNNAGSGDVIGQYDFPIPANIGEAAATIRFELRGRPITVECSSQREYRLNLRCIGKTIEAMRLNEKRGIADTIRKAYLQIEEPKEQRDPYEVLGIRPDTGPEIIKAAYLALAKIYHPDNGTQPDAAKMAEINEAHEIAIERIGQ